jgi:hypothetical protein
VNFLAVSWQFLNINCAFTILDNKQNHEAKYISWIPLSISITLTWSKYFQFANSCSIEMPW